MLYLTLTTGTGVAIPLHHVQYIQDLKDGGSVVRTDLPGDEPGKTRSFKTKISARELAQATNGSKNSVWFRRA